MRSFALVLLRRLLFRALPSSPSTLRSSRITLYDHLSEPTRNTLERALLWSLSNEPSQAVRPKLADTITDLAAASFERGRPWLALQAQSFSATLNADQRQRESAYRIFGSVPALMGDQQVDAVVRVLQRGLQDPESLEVRVFPTVFSYLAHVLPGPTCCSARVKRISLFGGPPNTSSSSIPSLLHARHTPLSSCLPCTAVHPDPYYTTRLILCNCPSFLSAPPVSACVPPSAHPPTIQRPRPHTYHRTTVPLLCQLPVGSLWL